MCQVSLTPANEQWIKLQIAYGEYDNESDLINQLIINAMNKQSREIEYIREKLIEGEQSGFIENFNPEQMLVEFKQRFANE
jgi:antitoxin ParD1/3/4